MESLLAAEGQLKPVSSGDAALEEFSPLHIEATLQLIRDEFDKGHEKLAEGLMERLQWPLTLGKFKLDSLSHRSHKMLHPLGGIRRFDFVIAVTYTG